MSHTQSRQQEDCAWLLDGGRADAFTPRDLFRAMCIARAMKEHGMAERLRVALQDAFQAAGVTVPEGAEAICSPLQ